LGERCDPGLADHRHGGEVERIEGLADRKPRLGQAALRSTLRAFGNFVFEERSKGAGCRPAVVHGGDKPGQWIVGGVPMRAV
jgi:hypothetical protein